MAAQLVDFGGHLGEPSDALARELTTLRDAGVTASMVLREVVLPDPMPDLTPLRAAIAAVRTAGHAKYDRFADALGWLFSTADWPLWALNITVNDEPGRRVELLMFDSEVGGPLWDLRARITTFSLVRLLSLRSNRFSGALGFDLAALPRLEYVTLSENLLARVPPELRDCRALVHLNLADNRLTSITADELPASLRWLDIGKNRLPDEVVAALRAARPDCKIHSYAQRPAGAR